MKILLEKNGIIKDILGTQRYDEHKDYRLLSYVVQNEIAGGLLLYNVLTKEFIYIDKDEDCNEYLVSNWFKVETGFNDKKLVLDTRRIVLLLSKQSNKYTDYTILPTTKCNARCEYCFEHGKPRSNMSASTATATSNYIKSTSAEEFGLYWFGGEPLLNEEAIDIITLGLSGEQFSSTMISNGYLFNDAMIQKAKELWHLKHVQITLDGTESIYNKMKSYVDMTDKSPFWRVIDNIGSLLQADVEVDIRLNLGMHNIGDAADLLEILSAEFHRYPNCRVYASILYQHLNDATLEIAKDEIDQMILSAGFRTESMLSNMHLRYHECQADFDKSVLITPEGNFARCEHLYDEEPYGNVWEGVTNTSVLESWKMYWPELPQCSDCWLFPDCFRLKKCELNAAYEGRCPDYRVKKMLEGLRSNMRYHFEVMKNSAI